LTPSWPSYFHAGGFQRRRPPHPWTGFPESVLHLRAIASAAINTESYSSTGVFNSGRFLRELFRQLVCSWARLNQSTASTAGWSGGRVIAFGIRIPRCRFRIRLHLRALHPPLTPREYSRIQFARSLGELLPPSCKPVVVAASYYLACLLFIGIPRSSEAGIRRARPFFLCKTATRRCHGVVVAMAPWRLAVPRSYRGGVQWDARVLPGLSIVVLWTPPNRNWPV
jgi:hypothetical protein